jgi:MFS family permease
MAQPSGLRLALTGLTILAIAIGIGRFAFTPILPAMQEQFGLSLRTAGLLASANYVGYFIGAFSAIWLRLSPALAARLSVLAVAVLTAAMAFTHSPLAWALLRGLAGIASAWGLVFASAWILPILAERKLARMGGILFAGVGSGIALTGLLCLVFLHWGWGVERIWVAMGLTAAVLSLLALRTQGGAAAVPPAGGDSAWRALRLPDNVRLVVSYGGSGFGYIIPATFLPAMARDIVRDPAVFGWAWPIFGTAAVLSVLVAGRLSTRYPFRRIWMVAQFVMAAGVAIPVYLDGLGGIVVSALFVGGTFMVTTMAGMQEGRRVGEGACDEPHRGDDRFLRAGAGPRAADRERGRARSGRVRDGAAHRRRRARRQRLAAARRGARPTAMIHHRDTEDTEKTRHGNRAAPAH